MARLDRLSRSERSPNWCTLGRELATNLSRRLPARRREVTTRAQQLVEAELVYQRGLVPQATIFKHGPHSGHGLSSVVESTGKQYHRQIAQVLMDRFPETVETQRSWCASLHPGRPDRASPALLAEGRGARQPALGLCGSDSVPLTQGLESSRPCRLRPERGSTNSGCQYALGPH